MRRLASLIVPVLALSACYNSYRGPSSEYGAYRTSGDRWYDAAEEPLVARIDQTGIGFGVRLNRPAYVAVFEILPGQGVGLYYPAFSAENAYFPTGFSTLPRHGSRRFDSYFTSNASRYSRGQPRFYFLVASRQPLRSIARIQHNNGALRSVLGLSAYNTVNYRQVMDDLVQAVVPYQNDEDWTTDVLAVWPRDYGYGYYADNDGYRRVRCADGTVEILPLELAQWGCRRQHRPSVVRAPRTADNPPPSRVDSVTPPSRRRPEPVAGTPADAEAEAPRRAPGRRPTPAPEAVDRPQVGDGDTRPTGSTRESGEERRERPRVEAPASEPREAPRAAPREESTRREAPAPREIPRAEPVRSAPPPPPPPPAPAPRSDPPAPRPERSRPVAPPAGG